MNLKPCIRVMPVLLAALLVQAQQATRGSDHAVFGAIDGTVVDLEGRPIGDARVYATWSHNDPDSRIRVEVLTDRSGQFHLPSVPAGTATIHAYKIQDGYADTSIPFFLTNPKSIRVVTAAADMTTSGVELQLGPKGGRLTGSVVDAKTGQPLPAATFKLIRAPDPGIWVATGLDETGRLLAPSTIGFRLEVFADHYRSWWFGGDQGESPQGIIKLNPGGELSLDIKLEPR